MLLLAFSQPLPIIIIVTGLHHTGSKVREERYEVKPRRYNRFIPNIIPMTPPKTRIRLIEEKRYFFVLWLLFTIIFFALAYSARKGIVLGTSSPYQYYTKYGLYLPLALGWLAILKSYILLFLTYLLHLRHTFVKVGIYILLYGFWLLLGYQLVYSEPRYTDLAIVLIDAYGLPLMIAASVTLFFVGVLSLIKK